MPLGHQELLMAWWNLFQQRSSHDQNNFSRQGWARVRQVFKIQSSTKTSPRQVPSVLGPPMQHGKQKCTWQIFWGPLWFLVNKDTNECGGEPRIFLDDSNVSLFEATAHVFECFQPKPSQKSASGTPLAVSPARPHIMLHCNTKNENVWPSSAYAQHVNNSAVNSDPLGSRAVSLKWWHYDPLRWRAGSLKWWYE